MRNSVTIITVEVLAVHIAIATKTNDVRTEDAVQFAEQTAIVLWIINA